MISAALCRGLIEARCVDNCDERCFTRFPRLYAAASLKRRREGGLAPLKSISAALCRGLIEAPNARSDDPTGATDFRGFMPRPH